MRFLLHRFSHNKYTNKTRLQYEQLGPSCPGLSPARTSALLGTLFATFPVSRRKKTLLSNEKLKKIIRPRAL